jgi:vacuolar-type H+-ATPase subunit I/STV1
MGELYGYDLAAESVDLFQVHEAHTYEKINIKNVAVERLADEMDTIEKFLAEVAVRTDDSKRLSYNLKAEDQSKIDAMRENESIRHAFPEGKYEWKDEEINNLTRMLAQYVEGPLQRKINMVSEEIMLEYHELTKATELFNRGVQRMAGLCERILSNMLRQ